MKPYRILIAEDDDLLLKVLQQVFMNNNFIVDTADNGINALELYQAHKPDVILMDIDMPEKDGWEVLRRIRKENDVVPIIIMTGIKISADDLKKSYDLGATNYIRKPFSHNEIIAIANSHIKSAYGIKKLLVFENLQLNISTFLLQAGNEKYQLSEREAKTLALLIKNGNQTVETHEILKNVWHNDELQINRQMLHNTISNLNKILKKHGKTGIKSVYNVGYVLGK